MRYRHRYGQQADARNGAQRRMAPGLLETWLLLLLAVLWGIPYALTKIALETIPPLTLVAVRTTLAAVVLWLVVFALRRRIPTHRAFIWRLFLQGCLGCLIPYALTTWGQQTVDSALAAVLNSTSPLFVCLAALIWTRHETITFGRVFGVAIGLGGIALIAGAGALSGLGREIAGQSAIVLAAFSLATDLAMGQPMGHALRTCLVALPTSSTSTAK